MTRKMKKNLLNSFKARKNTKKKSFSSRVFLIIIIGSLLLLLSSFVFQVGEMSRKTSLIKDYEEQADYLVQQNKELEVSFSKNNSLKNIEDSLQELNFEKVAQVEYIQVMDNAVAAK